MPRLLAWACLSSSACAATDTTTFEVTGALVGRCHIITEHVELHYRLKDFGGVGGEQPWSSFNITSAGCDEGVGPTLTLSMAGPADALDSTLFAVSGVTGVGLQIQTADGRAVLPDGTAPPQWPLAAAGSTYPYRARFMQNAASVTPGTGRATVVVTVAVD